MVYNFSTKLDIYEPLRDYDIFEQNDDIIVNKVSYLLPEEHASEKNVKTSDTVENKMIKRKHRKETNANKKMKHKRNFL